jgi:hypothetical protein
VSRLRVGQLGGVEVNPTVKDGKQLAASGRVCVAGVPFSPGPIVLSDALCPPQAGVVNSIGEVGVAVFTVRGNIESRALALDQPIAGSWCLVSRSRRGCWREGGRRRGAGEDGRDAHGPARGFSGGCTHVLPFPRRHRVLAA